MCKTSSSTIRQSLFMMGEKRWWWWAAKISTTMLFFISLSYSSRSLSQKMRRLLQHCREWGRRPEWNKGTQIHHALFSSQALFICAVDLCWLKWGEKAESERAREREYILRICHVSHAIYFSSPWLGLLLCLRLQERRAHVLYCI